MSPTTSERLRELVAINRAIAGTLDYDEVLELVVERTADFTAADGCALILAGADGRARVALSRGLDEEAVRRFAEPLDERINLALQELLGYREHDRFTGVPVIQGGRIRGVLAVHRRGPREPDPDEELLLSALADQAAIALEHAARYREVARREVGQARLLEAIQANTATALAYLDTRLVCREANEAFCRFVRRRRSAIIGRGQRELLPGPALGGRLEAVLRESRPARVLELPAPGRERERWDLYARPIAGEQGGGEGIVLTAIDVTEKVWAREALEQQARRKDDFLAVLSHELRNPLMPIRTSLYLLDRVPPAGHQARQAREIMERQIAHMARLVDDLLDTTRIARGKIELRRERIELGAVLRAAVDDHRSGFAARQVDLDVALPGRPLWLQADATRLLQVLGNLLGNALKFTPSGGRVWLQVEHDPAAAAVEIRVRDTGAGVPPALLATIFEPFSQVRGPREGGPGGLGLGLALVRGLVELHGGSVEARSEGEGAGTEVVVRLPVDGDGRSTTAEREAVDPAHRRLLLIEDDPDTARSLQLLLQADGHDVVVAATGEQGLVEARRLEPELVLCDIGLPGMDGYQVARALRAEPPDRPPVLVAVSGHTRREDRRAAAEAGFDQHLTKPLSIGQLRELLARLPA